MKSRRKLIAAFKLWQVYREGNREAILFEGCKTACRRYLAEHHLRRAWRRGEVCLAQLIWEDESLTSAIEKEQGAQKVLFV